MYSQAVHDICPGQTTASLKHFANNMTLIWDGKKQIKSKEPLYKICKKKLDDPSNNSFLGNENMANKKMEYINEILAIKEMLME